MEKDILDGRNSHAKGQEKERTTLQETAGSSVWLYKGGGEEGRTRLETP